MQFRLKSKLIIRHFSIYFILNKMSGTLYERFQRFIVQAIPLTIHLETVTTIIVTKGYGELYDMQASATACYYVYLASIYGLQILRVLFTKFLKGYSRGFWIHVATVIQFVLQLVLITGLLIYLHISSNGNWIYWELAVFILSMSSTMSIRLAFILIISLKVFRKNARSKETKEGYWLSMTTKEELFENDGKLCYDISVDFEENQKSILDNDYGYRE